MNKPQLQKINLLNQVDGGGLMRDSSHDGLRELSIDKNILQGVLNKTHTSGNGANSNVNWE